MAVHCVVHVCMPELITRCDDMHSNSGEGTDGDPRCHMDWSGGKPH